MNRPARVVVGVHRSIAGLRALRTAVERARRLDLPLYAVRAWEVEVTYGDVLVVPKVAQARLRADREITAAFSDIAGGNPHGVAVHRSTPMGRTGPALVALADNDDDLLVVGRGPHLPWQQCISGYCVRHARCPVLVLPPDALGRQAGRRGAGRLLSRELEDLTTRRTT